MVQKNLCSVLILIFSLVRLQAGDMHQDISEAISILTAKQTSERPIPAKILQQAKAIGIIEITKGAFGVGGASGEGIIVVKTRKGWAAPVAFAQGGGSFGFQIGVDIKKFIYIFNSDAAWRAFVGDEKIRFQAAAHATEGPDHVSAEAAKGLPDVNLYIYTLSDGVFAGTAIGGQMVGASEETNQETYDVENVMEIINGKVAPPRYAHALFDLLNVLTQN